MQNTQLDFNFTLIEFQTDYNIRIISPDLYNNLIPQFTTLMEFLDLLDAYILKSKKTLWIYVLNLNILQTKLNDINIKYVVKFLWEEEYEFNNTLYLLKLRRRKNTKKAIYFKDYYNFFTEKLIEKYNITEKYNFLDLVIKNIYETFEININKHTILSLSSISYNIFLKLSKEKADCIPNFSENLDSYIRQSYFGGRTEIFSHITEKSAIYYYDVNSLFPSVMAEEKYPIGYPKYHTIDYFSSPDFNILECFGFLKVTLYKDPKLNLLPVLPIRTDKLEDNIIYADGFISGVYFTEEIKLALENGYTLVKIFNGYLYENKQLIFDTFVNKVYNLRLHYKNHSEILNLFYKLILNSLYGRFSCIYESNKVYVPFILNESQCSEDFFDNLNVLKKRFVNIGIASAITSYARIKVYNKIKALQLVNYLLYWDTDGIFLTKPLPDKEIDSSMIGAFRLEAEVINCYFVSTKFYLYDEIIKNNNNNPIYMLRGVVTTNKFIYRNLFKDLLFKALKEAQYKKEIKFELIYRNLYNNKKETKLYTFKNKRMILYNIKENKYITRPYIIKKNGELT